MITITLTDNDAAMYLQNESVSESRITQLLSDFNAMRDERDVILAKYRNMQDNLPEPSKASLRVVEDSARAKELSPFTTKQEVKQNPPAYKSRIDKAGRKYLDELTKGKVRAKCAITNLAEHLQVRTSTVHTYVNKHSDNKYRLVPGASVKPHEIWDNSGVDDTEVYIMARY